jgi:Protein of unknown function (DUF3386)
MKKIILSSLYLALLSAYAFGQTSTATHPDSEIKADPAAYSMLRDVRQGRYYFPDNFQGFTATVVANDNGKVGRGELYYDVNGSADLDMKDDPGFEEGAWAVEAIVAIIGRHLSHDLFKEYERYPLTFGRDDHSPMGRLILVNDLATKASLRIRDGRITGAERTINGQRRIISILEETPIGEGKFLPHHFTVSYVDPKTGELKRTEAYTTEYKQVDELWLPSWQRIIRTENGKTITRIIEFYKPKIRFARPAR